MSDFTLPTMEKIERALAKDFVEAFGKGDLKKVYDRASVVAPKLFPARSVLNGTDNDKVSDLIADCFLILGKRS